MPARAANQQTARWFSGQPDAASCRQILRRDRRAVRPFCIIAQGKCPDAVIVTLPARRHARRQLPFLILINRAFKQVANHLNLGSPTALAGSSDAGSSLMCLTSSCFAPAPSPLAHQQRKKMTIARKGTVQKKQRNRMLHEIPFRNR